MSEIKVYNAFMELCIAHRHAQEWREVHGFGVGYMDMLDTGNLEQAPLRKGLFYSEKWYNSGMNPNNMQPDFPFVLMIPVAESGSIEPSGRQQQWKVYECLFYVLDLAFHDRNNSTATTYARRSREQVFESCSAMGTELLQELNRRFNQQGKDRMMLADEGRYRSERLYDIGAGRLAGASFECRVKVPAGCEQGTFLYDSAYVQKKEKFCGC
jgi:hypothetical protein